MLNGAYDKIKEKEKKTAALKLCRIGNLVIVRPPVFFTIHVLSIIEFSLSLCFFFLFFFHYRIDARTTQYYLPLLATTICLIDLYLCTWFIAICVHVVGQVGHVKVDRRTFNPLRCIRSQDPWENPLRRNPGDFLSAVHEEIRENYRTTRKSTKTESERLYGRSGGDIKIHTSHFSFEKATHYGIITAAFTRTCFSLL